MKRVILPLSTLSTLLLIVLITTIALPAAAQGPEPEPEVFPTATPEWLPEGAVDAADEFTGEETPTATPRPNYGLPVSVEANDGRMLAGELFLVNPAGVTVVLLHQLYTDRTSWDVVLGALLGTGINVLNVDVRGHGATGGAIDWNAAVDDVVVWMEWLRASGWVRADTIATMGSSMGSSLAILGCANDPLCRTAIGISPGWNYYELSVEPAFAELFGDRPVLLVLADWDGWPAQGVPRMAETAINPVTVQNYPGNQHGMDLFYWHDDLAPVVVEWLISHAG